jgi:hypothetical protein
MNLLSWNLGLGGIGTRVLHRTQGACRPTESARNGKPSRTHVKSRGEPDGRSAAFILPIFHHHPRKSLNLAHMIATLFGLETSGRNPDLERAAFGIVKPNRRPASI